MSFWRTTLQVASVLLLSAGIAAAQTPTTPSQTQPTTTPDQPAAAEPAVPTSAPPSDRRSLTEEVIVTGSRIRRKDLTTPAPVTVVTREQFESSGRMTIGDYLQTMPEQGNAPNFQLNTGGINYGADGATRINLRSLGVQRTLVLVNGRRVVPAGLGATAAVDLNTIPTEAVERVEILKDGASAVYGSDAIAGVVNVITRQRYNGTELGAQYGASTRADVAARSHLVATGPRLRLYGVFVRPWDRQLLGLQRQQPRPAGRAADPQGLDQPQPSGVQRKRALPGDGGWSQRGRLDPRAALDPRPERPFLR